jgi:hypothetical protein
MAVLASSSYSSGARGIATPPAATAESPLERQDSAVPVVQRIIRVDSSLAKAVRLAKSLTKRKNGTLLVNTPVAA